MAELAQAQEYKTKNILLEHPADWYIEKNTFAAVKDSLSDIINFYDNQGESNPKQTKLHKII